MIARTKDQISFHECIYNIRFEANPNEGGHGASSGDGSSSAPGEETLLQALQHKDREEQRAHEAQIAMAANRTLDNYLLGLTGPSDTTKLKSLIPDSYDSNS